MDRFITTIPGQNKQPVNIAQFHGNQEIVQTVNRIINTNGKLCLHGDSGTGKTFLVLDILLKNNTNVFEITGDHISSKAHTVDILDKLRFSSCHVVIDDIDVDTYGFREIADRLSQGLSLSRGCLIITTRTDIKIQGCESAELARLSVNDMVNFGRIRCPNRQLKDLVELAKKAMGNIRNFISSLEFANEEKDVFKSPKNLVYDMLCRAPKYPEHAGDYIGKSVEDHGYSWGIIHENYPDAPAVDTNEAADIAEWMSIADMIDTVMYDGKWDFTPIFSMYGIVMPALKIDHTLEREDMRPGSAWTKYGNYKMRYSRYKSIYTRNSRFKMDLDAIKLVHAYCVRDGLGAVPLLVDCKINSADMDTINHLSLVNKLKPKALGVIKKKLKDAAAASEAS